MPLDRMLFGTLCGRQRPGLEQQLIAVALGLDLGHLPPRQRPDKENVRSVG